MAHKNKTLPTTIFVFHWANIGARVGALLGAFAGLMFGVALGLTPGWGQYSASALSHLFSCVVMGVASAFYGAGLGAITGWFLTASCVGLIWLVMGVIRFWNQPPMSQVNFRPESRFFLCRLRHGKRQRV